MRILVFTQFHFYSAYARAMRIKIKIGPPFTQHVRAILACSKMPNDALLRSSIHHVVHSVLYYDLMHETPLCFHDTQVNMFYRD